MSKEPNITNIAKGVDITHILKQMRLPLDSGLTAHTAQGDIWVKTENGIVTQVLIKKDCAVEYIELELTIGEKK